MVLATPSLNIKKREFTMLLLFSIVVALLIVRIGWLQIVNGAELQKEAIEQQTRDRIVTPKRGTIYDVNGKELAISASVDTVSVIPSQIKQAEPVARRLSEILKLDYQEVLKKVTKKGSSIQIIARKVEMGKTEEIRKWVLKEKIDGIKINEDSKRCYPYSKLCYRIYRE
jgi:stage V sporulation protein D (sporulation-specific penicillin-binding protein)